MPTVLAELDLPHLAMDDPAFGADPQNALRQPIAMKSDRDRIITEFRQ